MLKESDSSTIVEYIQGDFRLKRLLLSQTCLTQNISVPNGQERGDKKMCLSKLDSALIFKLREFERDGNEDEELPIFVRINGKLSTADKDKLQQLGISLRSKPRRTLCGTVRAKDIAALIELPCVQGVALSQKLEFAQTRGFTSGMTHENSSIAF